MLFLHIPFKTVLLLVSNHKVLDVKVTFADF
jgi:hypothetical protein